MNVLFYKGLDYKDVKKQFDKTVDYLKNLDFISADTKKMQNTGFYRAKLDYENRLLFKFARYKEETHILLLEVIKHHNYNKSRFLRGAKIDENKFILLKKEQEINKEDVVNLTYVNPNVNKFHLLDKVISFDSIQEEIFKIKPPLVIIGSAGSGKTVLTLEKIKSLKGNILYATLSPYLAENSAKQYYSNNYINEKQDIDFLSYKEFLQTLKIIPTKELDFKLFDSWLSTRKHSFGIKESYKLFEEFRGVITGMEITKEYLSKSDYINLGIKQSIYLANEKEKVYEAFLKYLNFILENNYYDLNIISYRWLQYSKPKYDFIVIDEVQDFTNIQLYIILKALKSQDNFILCGDANQIVHPNFFSWTNVKTMFYKHDLSGSEIKILNTNYRNSVEITRLSNRLLKIKNARFGSIDKESTYLINAIAENKGETVLFKDNPKVRRNINEKTVKSTKFAVLVMKPDDKKEARELFKTPLIFSIQEAKGLEYENIILLNFISNYSNEFREITNGVTHTHIAGEQLTYSRGKDKSDKALDAYKFYINSLYVGLTRAMKNLYILESSTHHNILNLLELAEAQKQVEIKQEVSTLDEWKKEAKKLEQQGKKEQAEEIKKTILSIQKPDWEVITPENVENLKKEALDTDYFNKKAKDKLFAYAILYNDIKSLEKLAGLKYKKADNYENERNTVFRKYYRFNINDDTKGIEQSIKKYGVDYRDQFNLTPLLAASITGSVRIIEMLIGLDANPALTDNIGRNPLQVAIGASFHSKSFSAKFGDFYNGLVTKNIKIKVDDKLIKIDNHKIEYLLLNFFIALQSTIISGKTSYMHTDAVEAGDIEKVFSTYHENILPAFRKKRTYISANLSKNEIEGTNPWNRKLFIRTERGHYALNPGLDVLSNEKWKNIYDIMNTKKIKKLTPEDSDFIYLKNMKDALLSSDSYFNYPFLKEKNPLMAERLCAIFPEIAEEERKLAASIAEEDVRREKFMKFKQKKQQGREIRKEEKIKKEELFEKQNEVMGKLQFKLPFNGEEDE